jgi:hypothetical protein
MPITHHYDLHHDSHPIAMLKPPSIICNLTKYLHTHLGCALGYNVQKQQGKQILIGWLIKCLLPIESTSSRPTASRRHWLRCPPPIFTTSDLWGIFNTSTARSSGNMVSRYRGWTFCLLILSYLVSSILPRFHGSWGRWRNLTAIFY